MKQCTKCSEWKKNTAFSKQKKGKNGLKSQCRSCASLAFKKYYNANKEDNIKKSVEYHKNNPERVRAINRKWRETHREESKAHGRKNYQNHKESIKEYQKQYAKENSEKVSIRKRKYTQRTKAKRNEYLKQKRKEPMVKFKHYISTAIRDSLKGNKKGRKWESLVGYTLQDLMKHLKELFEPGMTWQNRGAWHIDHKIPVSAFNFTKPENIDFRKCWALSNLQPLWARDNMRKNRKLIKPFQPSLIF